jgi:hypothetical protein
MVQALEARRLLSAWYEYDVVARTGDVAIGGRVITSIGDSSINRKGRVAFVGFTADGNAVFKDDGPGASPMLLTFPPAAVREYAFPQTTTAAWS